MTTQLQQCREVAAALDEEVTEWRRKDAEWHEHRSAAEKALHDMPFVMDNYRAALARAEAAEAEAARLQYDLDRQLYRADALAARVAELEAQLAAQQWRPVTEEPEKPGWYVVYDSDGHVFYNADIFPYRVARWTGKWDSAFNGLVDYWRPLPPAPQETTP